MAARFDVNLSLLFTELPRPERPQAAKRAGEELATLEGHAPTAVALPDQARR